MNPKKFKLRILVVDDERDAADALAAALEDDSRQVGVAYDWINALECFYKLAPHVCLLDIGMEGLDGYYIARAIRATPGPKPLQVAVTARSGQLAVARSMGAGFDHHVAKPALAADLLHLIEASPRVRALTSLE